MYYAITKLALRVVRWAARRACKNPSPGAWQHLVKDAQGDIGWFRTQCETCGKELDAHGRCPHARPKIGWRELPVFGVKPNRFIDLQR